MVHLVHIHHRGCESNLAQLCLVLWRVKHRLAHLTGEGLLLEELLSLLIGPHLLHLWIVVEIFCLEIACVSGPLIFLFVLFL